MKETIMIKVNSEKPEMTRIQRAAKIIRDGGVVAFPTETVYGVGANALDPEAVMKVFEAKRRPLDNPLIVAVASKEEACKLTRGIPGKASELMDEFWPGPLTLVLKASKIIPKITTGGLDTVAIRMPSHEVALALIRESAIPIVAPSANLTGRPSPTTADHVRQDLAGRIDMILDAGPTKVGVESTVLDMTTDPPRILRPGGISCEELKRVLRHVELHHVTMADRETPFGRPSSLGIKHKHYALNAEMVVVEGNFDATIKKVQELANLYMRKGRIVGILATDESRSTYRADVIKSLGSREDLAMVARNLFKLLRELDEEKVDIIIAEGIAPKGLGLAVLNRLREASGFNIVKA